MPETKQRYVVEGFWDNGNDGCDPVTADFIAATSEKEAEAIVDKVRNKIDNWTHMDTRTFEDYLESEYRVLDKMKTMTIEDVEAAWVDTKECLYYEEDKVEEVEKEEDDEEDEDD